MSDTEKKRCYVCQEHKSLEEHRKIADWMDKMCGTIQEKAA